MISRRSLLLGVAVVLTAHSALAAGGLLAGVAPVVQSSAIRSPTIADDASRGNPIGRLWLNKTSGQFFTCSDNTNGAAVWASAGTPTALPGDAVASVAACYGTKPLKTSWANGNLFKVQRKSDNSQQIIAAVSGVTDIASLNSFLSGTVGQVIVWYDQSGNARDATQVTIGNAPYLRVLGSEVYVIWDFGSGGGIHDPVLNLPAFSWGTSLSVFCVGACTTVCANHAWFELSSLDQNNIFGFYCGSAGRNTWGGPGGLVSPPTFIGESSPNVWSMIGDNTNAEIRCGENSSAASAQFAVVGTPVGGTIGRATARDLPGTNTYRLDAYMQAFMIWTSKISGANALLARKACYQAFAIVPQAANDLIVYAGDSELSADEAFYPVGGGAGYIAELQALPLFNRPCRYINTAISGITLGFVASLYASGNVAVMDAAARNNLFIFNGGEHEGDALGNTPAQALAVLQSFITTIRGTSGPAWSGVAYIDMASYNAAVFGGGGETMEQWRERPTTGGSGFDPLVRNAGLNVDQLLDIGDPAILMGVFNGYSNAAYFAADGIHWNAAGHLVVAQLIANFVNKKLGAI